MGAGIGGTAVVFTCVNTTGLNPPAASVSMATVKRAAAPSHLLAVDRLEWAAALGLSWLAVWLHVEVLRRAGGLWRDEIGGVQLARLPALRDVRRWLTHDAFPLLFPMLVRGWSALGLGESDVGLRTLGFRIGCLLLRVVWLTTRWLGLKPPVLALGVFAVNLSVIRWGDALRAYGCGAMLILVTLGLVWRQMQSPSLVRWALASLTALLSVQCLYANAFLLLALCVAGAAVCAWHKQAGPAWSVLAIGIPAAASLLPYLRPITAAQDHFLLEKVTVNAGLVWANLDPAIGKPVIIMPLLWLFLAAVLVIAGVRCFRSERNAHPVAPDDRKLFAASTFILLCLVFCVYLKLSGLVKVWYFIPPMALGAMCLEAGLAVTRPRLRALRLAVVVLLMVAAFPSSLRSARAALTEMDTVAGAVQRQAQPGDLVVVYPWYLGVSFGRYFKGDTAWVTLPEIEDRRFHRYDLVKEKILTEFPVRPVLARMEQTLRSGGRVWFVGEPPAAAAGETAPPIVPPGPLPGVPNGWWEVSHSYLGLAGSSFFEPPRQADRAGAGRFRQTGRGNRGSPPLCRQGMEATG
jgi:hypothetical protein